MVAIAGLGLTTTEAFAAGPVPIQSTKAEAQIHRKAPLGALSGGEEQVTVTVRRRSEPLQKVPVATSIFTAKDAARNNVHDLQGIFQFIPSANFRTSASSKDRTVFVRGIGTISTSPGVEPSVSTVLDGVVLARSGQATADLLDLEHIEVLRGPQATLVGKNASAGAVNIVTAAPTEAFHAHADASYFSGAANHFFDDLNGYGIFPVRNGELESWLKPLGVPGAKTKWAVGMLEALGSDPNSGNYVRPGNDDVWAFLRDVIAWVKNPARKGTS